MADATSTATHKPLPQGHAELAKYFHNQSLPITLRKHVHASSQKFIYKLLKILKKSVHRQYLINATENINLKMFLQDQANIEVLLRNLDFQAYKALIEELIRLVNQLQNSEKIAPQEQIFLIYIQDVLGKLNSAINMPETIAKAFAAYSGGEYTEATTPGIFERVLRGAYNAIIAFFSMFSSYFLQFRVESNPKTPESLNQQTLNYFIGHAWGAQLTNGIEDAFAGLKLHTKFLNKTRNTSTELVVASTPSEQPSAPASNLRLGLGIGGQYFKDVASNWIYNWSNWGKDCLFNAPNWSSKEMTWIPDPSALLKSHTEFVEKREIKTALQTTLRQQLSAQTFDMLCEFIEGTYLMQNNATRFDANHFKALPPELNSTLSGLGFSELNSQDFKSFTVQLCKCLNIEPILQDGEIIQTAPERLCELMAAKRAIQNQDKPITENTRQLSNQLAQARYSFLHDDNAYKIARQILSDEITRVSNLNREDKINSSNYVGLIALQKKALDKIEFYQGLENLLDLIPKQVFQNLNVDRIGTGQNIWDILKNQACESTMSHLPEILKSAISPVQQAAKLANTTLQQFNASILERQNNWLDRTHDLPYQAPEVSLAQNNRSWQDTQQVNAPIDSLVKSSEGIDINQIFQEQFDEIWCRRTKKHLIKLQENHFFHKHLSPLIKKLLQAKVASLIKVNADHQTLIDAQRQLQLFEDNLTRKPNRIEHLTKDETVLLVDALQSPSAQILKDSNSLDVSVRQSAYLLESAMDKLRSPAGLPQQFQAIINTAFGDRNPVELIDFQRVITEKAIRMSESFLLHACEDSLHTLFYFLDQASLNNHELLPNIPEPPKQSGWLSWAMGYAYSASESMTAWAVDYIDSLESTGERHHEQTTKSLNDLLVQKARHSMREQSLEILLAAIENLAKTSQQLEAKSSGAEFASALGMAQILQPEFKELIQSICSLLKIQPKALLNLSSEEREILKERFCEVPKSLEAYHQDPLMQIKSLLKREHQRQLRAIQENKLPQSENYMCLLTTLNEFFNRLTTVQQTTQALEIYGPQGMTVNQASTSYQDYAIETFTDIISSNAKDGLLATSAASLEKSLALNNQMFRGINHLLHDENFSIRVSNSEQDNIQNRSTLTALRQSTLASSSNNPAQPPKAGYKKLK